MTLRGLNWRRGLFRLWLIASLLWVAAISVLWLGPATYRYIESVRAKREISFLKAKLAEDGVQVIWFDEVNWKKPPSALHYLDGLVHTDKCKAAPPTITKYDDGSVSVEGVGSLRFPNGTSSDVIDEVLRRETPRLNDIYLLEVPAGMNGKNRQQFLFYSGMAFIPPMALFIVSAGLLWAASGFAPKTGNDEPPKIRPSGA